MLETRPEILGERAQILQWTKMVWPDPNTSCIYLLVSQVQAHNLPEGTTLVEVSWRFWWQRQLRQLRQFTGSGVSNEICLFCRSNLSKHQKMWPPKRVVCWNLGVLGPFFWNLASKKGHKVCDWSWRSVWHRFAKFVIEQKVATPEGLKDWKSQETPEELRVPCVEQWKDRHKRI